MAKDSRLIIRAEADESHRWKAEAKASGLKLSEWVRRRLNSAAVTETPEAVTRPASKVPTRPSHRPGCSCMMCKGATK